MRKGDSMEYKIALNPRQKKEHTRAFVTECSLQVYDALTGGKRIKELVEKINATTDKEEQKKLKERLPFRCPHYTRFRDDYRDREHIDPESFTWQTCVDIDDEEMVETANRRSDKLDKEPGMWQGMMLHKDFSARRKLHIDIRLPMGMTVAEAQTEYCKALGVKPDTSCLTPERFIYITPADFEIYRSEGWYQQLSDEEIAQRRKAYTDRGLSIDGRDSSGSYYAPEEVRGKKEEVRGKDGLPVTADGLQTDVVPCSERTLFIFDECMKEAGLEKEYLVDEGARHNSLKSILSVGATQLLKKEELMGVLQVRMTEHWQDKNTITLVNDFYAKYTDPNQKLTLFQRRVLAQSLKANYNGNDNENENKEGLDLEEDNSSIVNSQLSINRMPMGVRDSIEAASPSLAMMMVTAICPCIGALATGVSLDVHGDKRGLNLISYIVGDPGSGKGKVDPVVDAWMAELRALDKMYEDQEKDWRRRKVAAKNKKEQPEEIALPVRCLTLNNTVANLAERLSNTEGKHAFSFTPEADTVAQKWKSTMSDFSVMLRQGYDGSRYEREARSAEAVNVHIEHLLWNVTMCGTPDALYRVVSNYTDGLQTRIAVASAIDNTFLQLEDKNPLLTDKQSENIRMIAHLLPLMHGEAVLPKLEQTGRAWLERIRLETMMNDDKVKARQRFRICVTAQRMTCCLMLCKVCEQLIQKHGLSGAESRLKQNPNLWKEMLLKTQTSSMLAIYDVIADSLMENALFYFRERIENAYNSRNYAGNSNSRIKPGKNDSIYARLDTQFTFEQAMQQTIAIKGAGVTRNSVQQMLKNWCKQGLAKKIADYKFAKQFS